MCNLYANTLSAEAMRRLFAVAPEHDALGNFAPQTALYPRDRVAVVWRDRAGVSRLSPMHWGFVLPQTSARTGAPILPKAVNNARDDRLRASAFWRESFERRRCLVPATAFCEPKGRRPAVYHWFGVGGTGEPPEGEGGRLPFTFAGLWRRYRGPYRDKSVEIDTVAIVTTRPNVLTAEAHPDRMPAIIDPGDRAVWLGGGAEEAAALIRPYPAQQTRLLHAAEAARSDPPQRSAAT